MKSVTYSIDSIAWCELIEIKSSRGVFRLVYSRNHGHNSLNLDTSSSSEYHVLSVVALLLIFILMKIIFV